MLNTDLQSDLPTTLADRVQMQQLIANLARNGTEAMETVTDRPKELLISSRQEGDDIVIHVADCGVGTLASRERPALPVILITAHDSAERQEETLRSCGRPRFLFRKPFNGLELLDAVRALLNEAPNGNI